MLMNIDVFELGNELWRLLNKEPNGLEVIAEDQRLVVQL
jgi:hypothetical protein